MEDLKPEAYYTERANKVIRAIKEDEFTTPADLSVIIGMAVSKFVEAYVKSGGKKKRMIDIMCEGIKYFSE